MPNTLDAWVDLFLTLAWLASIATLLMLALYAERHRRLPLARRWRLLWYADCVPLLALAADTLVAIARGQFHFARVFGGLALWLLWTASFLGSYRFQQRRAEPDARSTRAGRARGTSSRRDVVREV